MTTTLRAFILASMAFLFTGVQAADSLPKPDDLASVAKSMPALVDALSTGADKVCVPTHLTLSARKNDGSRLFVTALVGQFPEELRKSAKGSSKLTKTQAHEVQTILNYATHAQSDASGFPAEALVSFNAKTGMDMTADMLCLSRERLGEH